MQGFYLGFSLLLQSKHVSCSKHFLKSTAWKHSHPLLSWQNSHFSILHKIRSFMVSLHLLVQINFSLVQPKPREVQWHSPVCHSCCPQDTFNKIISRYCRNSSEVFGHIIFTSEENFERNR